MHSGLRRHACAIVIGCGVVAALGHVHAAMTSPTAMNPAVLLPALAAITLGAMGWRWSQLQDARRDAATEARHADAAGSSFEADAKRSWAANTFQAAMVAISIAATASLARDGYWLIATGMLAAAWVFAFALLARLQLRLRPGPMLMLNAHALHHALFAPIPWQEIIGIELQQSVYQGRQQQLLHLGVRQPWRFIAPTPMLLKVVHGFFLWQRRRPDYGVLTVPLDALHALPAHVYQQVLTYRQRIDAPLLSCWHHTMSAIEVETGIALQALQRRLDAVESGVAGSGAIDAIRLEMARLSPRLQASTQKATARQRRTQRQLWLLGAAGLAVAVIITAALVVR